jgi:CRISPR-associated protein Csm3
MESGLMIYTAGNVVSCKTLQGKEVQNDEKLKAKSEAILKVFGSSGSDNEDETGLGPTRASFSDCYLEDAWKQQAKDNRWLLTEEKSENVINRIKGTAEHPRFIERVPEGARFNFLITFKILQVGDEQLFNDVLLKGLKLLEMDTLGGNGSRGYGRIAFTFKDEAMNAGFSALNPF